MVRSAPLIVPEGPTIEACLAGWKYSSPSAPTMEKDLALGPSPWPWEEELPNRHFIDKNAFDPACPVLTVDGSPLEPIHPLHKSVNNKNNTNIHIYIENTPSFSDVRDFHLKANFMESHRPSQGLVGEML